MGKTRNSDSSKRLHVIKRDSGWALKRQGASRANKIYGDENKAIKAAESYRKKGHDVVVHKKDGTIQNWKSAKKNAK